jgi:4-cresol dehydrogenase (hydroxylating)
MTARYARFEDAVPDLVEGTSPRAQDLTGQSRRPAGVLRPRTKNDVVRIVQAAQRHRVKLHAMSTGRNWGFGSALPAHEDAWIVSLENLKRISEFNPQCGSIRVEPGVTQIDLFRELDRLGGNWFFNVTGAGYQTSLLGNALERGVGYHGQRQLDLIDLEVVTGRGEIISSCPGTDAKGAAGLGADLTQMFVQSALGIVVSARLRLIPRSTGGGASLVRLKKPEHVDDFFESVLALKVDGAISGVPHIANRARIVTTMAPWLPPEAVNGFEQAAALWTAALPVTGCREMTDAAFSLIRKRLGRYCEIEELHASRDAFRDEEIASPMKEFQKLASGFPSSIALAGVEYAALGRADTTNRDPEATGAGLIHVTPSVPSNYKDIKKALRVLSRASESLGLEELPVTVNVVSQFATVLIISVSFPADQASAYRKKARALEARLMEAGLMPYRIGLGQEHWLPAAATSACEVYHCLKTAFDPYHILADSKYEAPYRKPFLVPRTQPVTSAELEIESVAEVA